MFQNTECPSCNDEINKEYRKDAEKAIEALAEEFGREETARKIQEDISSAIKYVGDPLPFIDVKSLIQKVHESTDQRTLPQQMTSSPEEAAMWALHIENEFRFKQPGNRYELKCEECSD